MASSTIKKITTRAKQIYKKGGTWMAAIKKAGAEYRAGKKSPAKKRRKVSGTLSAGASKGIMGMRRKKRRKVSGTLSAGASKGIMGVRSTFNAAAIGGLSTASLISRAKENLKHEIGKSEAQKFAAPKKSAKKKIAKKIAALKSKYRKLC